MRGLALVGVAAIVAALHGCTPMAQSRVETADSVGDSMEIPIRAALGAARDAVGELDGIRDSLRRDIRRALGLAEVSTSMLFEVLDLISEAVTHDDHEDAMDRLEATLPCVASVFLELAQLLDLAGVPIPPKVSTVIAILGAWVGSCDA